MPNQQIVEYVKIERAKGTSNEQIRNTLLGAQWRLEDINAALIYVAQDRDLSQIPNDNTPLSKVLSWKVIIVFFLLLPFLNMLLSGLSILFPAELLVILYSLIPIFYILYLIYISFLYKSVRYLGEGLKQIITAFVVVCLVGFGFCAVILFGSISNMK